MRASADGCAWAGLTVCAIFPDPLHNRAVPERPCAGTAFHPRGRGGFAGRPLTSFYTIAYDSRTREGPVKTLARRFFYLESASVAGKRQSRGPRMVTEQTEAGPPRLWARPRRGFLT